MALLKDRCPTCGGQVVQGSAYSGCVTNTCPENLEPNNVPDFNRDWKANHAFGRKQAGTARPTPDKPPGKYWLWYVKDVNIPKDHPNARDNQVDTYFNWWFQIPLFLLRNKQARDSVQANRFQFFTIQS